MVRPFLPRALGTLSRAVELNHVVSARAYRLLFWLGILVVVIVALGLVQSIRMIIISQAVEVNVLRSETAHMTHGAIQHRAAVTVALAAGRNGEQIASIGKVIQVQLSYLQFPLAAANAVVLLAAVLLVIVGMTRMVDIRREL